MGPHDEKHGLQALGQTVEPLLNAYRDLWPSSCCLPRAAIMHRYIILLLATASASELAAHLARLDGETLEHTLVRFAMRSAAAFQTGDYARFLRLYQEADFLTAVAMSRAAGLARVRSLFYLVRAYPQAIGDRLHLANVARKLALPSSEAVRKFATSHGLQVVDDVAARGGGFLLLPRRGTPEATQLCWLQNSCPLPQCPAGCEADAALSAKFESLRLSRSEIVFGQADPTAEV